MELYLVYLFMHQFSSLKTKVIAAIFLALNYFLWDPKGASSRISVGENENGVRGDKKGRNRMIIT